MNPTFEHMLQVTLAAASGNRGVLSMGEHLASALALNRADWLAELGYTIPEALSRIGVEWSSLLPEVERAAGQALAERAQAKETAAQAAEVAIAFAQDKPAAAEPVRFLGTLVTHSYAPGYRDVDFTFRMQRSGQPRELLATIRVGREDTAKLVRIVTEVHDSAWRRGAPLDAREDERRPAWLRGV